MYFFSNTNVFKRYLLLLLCYGKYKIRCILCPAFYSVLKSPPDKGTSVELEFSGPFDAF